MGDVQKEPFELLQHLPEELLQNILAYTNSRDQKALSLTSRWGRHHAAPLLWQNVDLVDCRTSYSSKECDEHDDTPIIKKLIILATNPQLASSVQTLTHRCHLPPPAIFNELPWNRFSNACLSTDPRTIELLKRAVANMTKIQTLRIIFGHTTLSEALLRCFFDVNRARLAPLRRLWLENVRITVGGVGDLVEMEKHPYDLPLRLDYTGLESVRYRRSPLWQQRIASPFGHATNANYRVYLRGYHAKATTKNLYPQYGTVQNGEGGLYETALGSDIQQQKSAPSRSGHPALLPPQQITPYQLDWHFDDMLYRSISQGPGYPVDIDNYALPTAEDAQMQAYEHFWISEPPISATNIVPPDEHVDLSHLPSTFAALWPLKCASQSLTHLNLDWMLPGLRGTPHDARQADEVWPVFLDELFSLRFPRLRSFQLRNAVVQHTKLPDGFYLFDQGDFSLAALEFMEAHKNLQCLAWPMDHFFGERRQEPAHARRVESLIERLGRTLTDLRVDTLYSGGGEAHSEDHWTEDLSARERRRAFISRFASKMTRLESIKIEGGMPRDERRETIRALGHCQLKKLVLIGVTSPIGNTWGPNGRDLPEFLTPDETADLEAEDKDAVFAIGPTTPTPPSQDTTNKPFTPIYGWPASPPMLHTIASHHASTITELKFCGYKGSACLYEPTPITTPLLAALKHFHNLETLVLSTWLSTLFEHSYHDPEIIAFWLNTRNPASTALVPATPIADEDLGGWALALKTRFAPEALAARVVAMFGPLLSERAKGREGGVKVRASFCLGDWGGIFDIDVGVGKGEGGSGRDVVVGFEGPREELEPMRRRQKLEGRRWF
ncbi:hypothetical protein MBLNU230_g6874t1 [Neophaeotheca triangularis]